MLQGMRRGGRDLRIDAIKGFLIFLVLWGHVIQNITSNEGYYDDWIFRIIYSFHMPLFALMNGYLFYPSQQKRDCKKALQQKIIGLLVPIMAWTTLDWMLGGILHRKIEASEWIDILGGNMLWFLWSVLAANLVLIIAEKILKHRMVRMCWIIIGFFLMYLFPNPELNLFLYPYIVLGFYYKKYSKSFGKIKKYVWISVPIYVLFLCFYDKTSFIYTTGISIWKQGTTIQTHIFIDLYRYFIGFVGSIAIIYLVCILFGKFNVLDKCLCTCGKYTMQIYITQCFFFKLFGMVWNRVGDRLINTALFTSTITRDFVMAIPASLVLVVILLLAAKIFEKNKLLNKVLFGR